MVEEVHLQRIDGRFILQVDLSPLVRTAAGRKPVALAVLVREVRRLEGGRGLRAVPLREALRLGGAALLPARRTDRLTQRQQHPAREGALSALHGGREMWIIPEACIRPHYAILVEESRISAEAALPVDDGRQRHRRVVPVLASRALHSASVARTAHIAARLVGEGVVRLVGIGAQRVLRSIDPVAVDIEFGAWSGIFHIICVTALAQPGAFDVGGDARVGMVLPEALPAVRAAVRVEKLHSGPADAETVAHIQLLAPDREDVGRAPEHIGLAVVVDEERRILQVVKDQRSALPLPRRGVVRIEHAHRAGGIAADVEQRIAVVPRRRRVRTLRIPGAGRPHELPVGKVLRVPVAQAARHEHIVLAPELHHRRIRTRAVGQVLVRIVDGIGVVYVQGVAIGLRKLTGVCAGERKGQRCEAENSFHISQR